MTAVFAQSGNYVGCGGMDNQLTIYDVNNRDTSGAAKMIREFAGYEGFLSSCRWFGQSWVVSYQNKSQGNVQRTLLSNKWPKAKESTYSWDIKLKTPWLWKSLNIFFDMTLLCDLVEF